MIERKVARSARIGFFCVGHKPYWVQFDGLLDSLLGFHGEAKKIIEANEVEVIDYGMVDDNIKSFEVAKKMRADELDLIICNMVTYATSSTYSQIIQNVDVPVILIALQPLRCLDYTKTDTYMELQNDNICAVSEFVCAANKLNKKVHDVICGCLYGDAEVERDIREWCDIAKVLNGLKGARIALMGHVMEAMYDMHADPVSVTNAFHIHVPLLEIEDIVTLAETVTQKEIEEKRELILREFETPEPKQDPVTTKLSEKDLLLAAKYAVALDKLVENTT